MTIRREWGGRFAALRPRQGARGVPVPAILFFAWALAMSFGWSGCGSAGAPAVTVNSLEDTDQPPPGTVTLRSALRDVPDGGRIVFDGSLNGGTIGLRLVGADNTVLKAEVYSGMTFLGYQERNFGRSALYVRKNVTIDASDLPDGITIRWEGDGSTQARVLAVYGNLTMRNVTVTGGRSCAEPIPGGTQPFTLARGGGIAVWGTATLQRCTVSDNRCEGDNTASRDRGASGGGIYADGLQLEDCIVSGNSAVGYGAQGGGIYSVGGGGNPGGRGNDTRISRCAITGNRVTAPYAYGGGVFTLSGGPNNLATMTLSSCTVARNLVEDNPLLAEAVKKPYYRGGGVYVGGGSLSVSGCTIVENKVTGRAVTIDGKPNMSGGGIAATIGNAHTVEEMRVSQSIVAGNSVGGAADDLFSGSLLHFYSDGYNRIGRIDFSQILVPIPAWWCLSRKHWPKAGDVDNVALAGVVDVANAGRHDRIRSAGTDNGAFAVLWYPPLGGALDQVPASGYQVDDIVLAEYRVRSGATDDFLPVVLDRLSTGSYGAILGSGFGANYRASFEAAYGSLDNVVWYEAPRTWPSDPRNAPWINFWRGLDNAIAGRLGSAGLGDDFWGTFETGPLTGNVTISVYRPTRTAALAGPDQLGRPRPAAGSRGDIGAIER